MASTPEGALSDHFKAIGDRKEIRLADALHLPFQQYGWGVENTFQWSDPGEVPEYATLRDRYAGSYCELNSFDLIGGNDTKQAYKVSGTLFNSDGSVMQTFKAIYTLLDKDGDWRVVQRNPLNVVPAA